MNKIKYLLLILSLFVCLSLVGCDLLFGDLGDHVCFYTEWEEIEEATCTKNGMEERYCIICFDEQTRVISNRDHSFVDYEGMDATCTEVGCRPGIYCSECMGILEGLEEIPAFGHTEVIDPAVEPTDDTLGRTEGKHCATCGEILLKQTTIFPGDYSNQNKYDGDYALNSLLKLKNGKGMAEFYSEIDALASDFHDSLNDAKYKENNNNGIYYLAEVYYSDNGISTEEALSAWNAYIKDHPLYYWMSVRATYTDEYLTIIVDDDYISGDTREQINADIYKTIEKYILSLNGESSTYGITLGLHDVIIEGADYAYEADGVTPSDEISAHNIIGVLLEGEGVCESYAKTFQLFLNYLGIENVFVTGYAGEAHGWNLVQMDDGRWYWYDLTWDDQPNWMLGVRHNYFCVSSSEFVNWNDGGSAGSIKFLDDHIPTLAGQTGINYSYELPPVSNTPYTYDGLMLRDQIIEKDGLSYVLIGFGKLALIDINKEGSVVIPETVSYDGNILEVACIGKYDSENGIMLTGSIIKYDSATRSHIDVTSVSIPSGVRFIWDFAFDYCYTIENFVVSEDNNSFASKDGILFTKSLYTLIKYPLAKRGSSYTIPTETVEIAFGAFGDGGNVFCPEYLNRLVIPKTVDVIGALNGGRGFRDSKPTRVEDIYSNDGYIDRLYSIFGCGLTIK